MSVGNSLMIFGMLILVVVVAVLICYCLCNGHRRRRQNTPPPESDEPMVNRPVQLPQPARHVRRANGPGGGGYMANRQLYGGGQGHTGGTPTSIRPSAPPPPRGDEDLPPSYAEAVRQSGGGGGGEKRLPSFQKVTGGGDTT